jgi:catechol 2,3-dioxygenase-like lactoylglutathione lyase family enzyme
MARSRSVRVFRVLVGARDLDRSRRFYRSLLGVAGRVVAPGRVYFDCGPVILGVLDVSRSEVGRRSVPTEALYFATDELSQVHRRAKRLGALSRENIHNDPASPAGEIVVRPWGERSFYLEDPSGNPLCFVDARTLFTGTPRQITALAHAGRPARPVPRAKGRTRRRRRSPSS